MNLRLREWAPFKSASGAHLGEGDFLLAGEGGACAIQAPRPRGRKLLKASPQVTGQKGRAQPTCSASISNFWPDLDLLKFVIFARICSRVSPLLITTSMRPRAAAADGGLVGFHNSRIQTDLVCEP